MSNSVTYRGVTASQAKNNHVILVRYDQMVMHAACDRKLSEDELKCLIEDYFKLIDEFFKERTEE